MNLTVVLINYLSILLYLILSQFIPSHVEVISIIIYYHTIHHYDFIVDSETIQAEAFTEPKEAHRHESGLLLDRKNLCHYLSSSSVASLLMIICTGTF